jgi:hypothetical protein
MSKVIRTPSRLLAAVFGVFALTAAQAQSPTPQQDKMTRRQTQAVDPFSPFVYDVLGATPSIHFRKGKSVAGPVGQQQASAADRPVAAQKESKGFASTAHEAKEATVDVEVRQRTHAQE